ncbi:MAG: hypothetical protein ACOX88_00590 [Christensenellales bacterium]|jgi:ethanolamine utilization cobalamin adenosyltransferase
MKSEWETSLRAGETVRKDHPQIVFRGELDLTLALFADTACAFKEEGKDDLAGGLESIIALLRRIQSCEVTNAPVGGISMLDMDSDTLRRMSHHPKREMGVEHVFADASMGRDICRLNVLRAQVRKVEVAAVTAFCGGEDREDILMALNRISSAVYVMMCLRRRRQTDERTMNI